MNCLIVLAAAVGIATASPVGILQDPPADVFGATRTFVQEYNRLAKLAADAPDIEVYNDQGVLIGANNIITPSASPAVSAPQQIQRRPQAVASVNPLTGVTVYSFAANLGSNSQFQPNQFQSFPQTDNRVNRVTPVQRVVQPQVVPASRPTNLNLIQPTPTHRWNGPFAHSIPAGVNGLPQQVGDTPEVAAAKNNHFRVLGAAFQRAAEAAARAKKTQSQHVRQQ